ncbi:bifunctional methylenetetrahydrofolate dehydrogenase/methenyltetrahydrofolate cyclohydrolase [Lentilactobacillus hilgardii]|uniref:Bifunctional protein FolD n=1 Tax=Lentilactobacillus hilgardii (strain ATCC 8290 / DSM 20176 / CCUG 30140 / JCM 1155 / KCTC 3500 / NBRC 15886 / NCIMB 8040 / NRRL B-1843 / 9) TaxID=1423757 RepID=C0XM78_LENH9|nr:bifunctional methylenetetrahydrofolate dehydrogenase/methenyltetrahydrofolate cyclohydrolase [Lentilactobacillus hilgardii]EEI23426.1 tetrahydrofolate dehydrogenase/cyclohydrolase, NAD(P)-binding domain protein [Lentilactobacillus hilgardii DSM 20176 = ATCC 8290]KRK58445.1 5,10-methylene-tetrahydrofolate dehydrogenase methenyl tetrahydrofolate cyclohydrolase [Lentilactobacillus hilgardii DSM 20176 = ATCC 8290]QEU38689.1 bifunctional methylenetetrahydrofolate dehydrogenase/methenyltetrahydrofo
MATVIDGRALAKKLNQQTSERVQKMQENDGITPGLVVIIVGDDPASQRYVRNKHRTAQRLGINSIVKQLPESVSEKELLKWVDQYNNDPTIHGILVQDPLPDQINEKDVTRAILPEKDVDGFHPVNVGKLFLNDSTKYPVSCTPKGIMTMFSEYHIELKGKNAVMLGRSAIVGKPMAALMLNQGASVSILHRLTKDITEYTKDADIIVSATGQLHTLTKNDVKVGATVIDVGQNLNEEGHLVGDVDYDDLFDKVAYITPVPGGVGPMTIATLMQQSVDLAEWSIHRDN